MPLYPANSVAARFLGRIDVADDRHGDAGHDRAVSAGPASPAAVAMVGTTCSAMARSFAQYVMVPSARCRPSAASAAPAQRRVPASRCSRAPRASRRSGRTHRDGARGPVPWKAALSTCDVLAGVARRMGVGETVHPLDHHRVRRPDAEHRTPAACRLRRQRLLRHGQRMARIGRHDGGAQLDP